MRRVTTTSGVATTGVAMRRKILETNHVLFEDDDEVRALEEWLIGAVNH